MIFFVLVVVIYGACWLLAQLVAFTVVTLLVVLAGTRKVAKWVIRAI